MDGEIVAMRDSLKAGPIGAVAYFTFMETPRFLSGKLLLAMPGIGDPRFERAVIAMCVHDENGAVGIGIGHQRAGIGVRGLLQQLGIDPSAAPDGPVLHGGPVEPGRGFVRHSDEWGGQDTILVVGIGALSGTSDILKAIAEGKGPSRYLIALGYAGWGEGQLDEEMTRPGWFTTGGSQEILFETPTEHRWEAGFKAEGIDPRRLASGAGAA